jgi:hypothetical protein
LCPRAYLRVPDHGDPHLLPCYGYLPWRSSGLNTDNAIKKELAKLLAAGFIKEVFHSEWLANPVLVCKKNLNEWRMCIDYIDLNKHYPKDPFGLPRIDQVIDSTAGCNLLSFLDCYSGYHQIAIKEEDQEKTAFITPFWRVLLHDHVLRVEERRCYIPTSYPGLLQEATKQERRSLRG